MTVADLLQRLRDVEELHPGATVSITTRRFDEADHLNEVGIARLLDCTVFTPPHKDYPAHFELFLIDDRFKDLIARETRIRYHDA